MIPNEEILEAKKKEAVRKEAKARLLRKRSYECPVYKALDRVLEMDGPLDIEHAIDLFRIEIAKMPEAAATADLLGRLKKCGS